MLLESRLGSMPSQEIQAEQYGWHVQVKETVRDVAMLHNESFFAAAQKKHAYIYDKHGLEVHCLKVCLWQ